MLNRFFELSLIIAAVSAVGIADVLIKKAASGAGSFSNIIKNPLIFAVIGLYLIQIIIFYFIFFKKAELGIVGIIQTALYAIIVIGSGLLFFNENISLMQAVGIGLAILGVVLINI